MKALEEGRFTCFFAPTLSEQNFVGGLVYILGDHMGQIKHAKIPSPKSKEGTDRYVFVANEKISQLTRADIEKFKRDVPKTLMNIRKAQSELTAGIPFPSSLRSLFSMYSRPFVTTVLGDPCFSAHFLI